MKRKEVRPLNPPPEPVLTFDEWYGEFQILLANYRDAVWLDERATARAERLALLAHARKRL